MVEVIGIDHIYISVSDINISEVFYDVLLVNILGFRKNTFTLSGDVHIQYFNRFFGYVLRPARLNTVHNSYAAGLHHFCLRVASISDVIEVASQLRLHGIQATEATLYPEYAPDYMATFFADPDGIRLEVTNYRLERQARFNHWDSLD